MGKRYLSTNMPSPKTNGSGVNFFKAWREHRGMSQTAVAKLMGISVPSISRVENGHTHYSQDFLEGYAQAVGVEPAILQMGEPKEYEQFARMLGIWKQLHSSEREIAMSIIETTFKH